MAAQYLAAAAALGDEAAEQALPGVLQQIEEEKSRAGPAPTASADVGGRLAADAKEREQGSLPQQDSAAAAGGDVGGRSAADTQSREQGAGYEGGAVSPQAKKYPPNAVAPSLLQDESWIREQDPNRYTIQVIALSSQQRLEALVRGFEDAGPFAYFVVQKSSKPLYVLLQGSYPDARSARAAGARIPGAIQNQEELWIRRFDGVQDSLE
jgi:septal ring-binding cell division protein DamX